jgi:hypothetical protein
MNSYRRSIKLSKESAKPHEDSPAQMLEQLIRAILAARKKSK